MKNHNHQKGEENGTDQVALFIDFENLAISSEETFNRFNPGILIQVAEQAGRCTIRRAYGDWTRFSKYSRDLLEQAIEAIQLFHFGGMNDKNAADIQMASDMLETLFNHPEIGVFVLATGDSDFSAVARKLRSYGKWVIGVGLQRATSEVLVKSCDQFVIYDTIVEPGTRTQSYALEQAQLLLSNVMVELIQQSKNPQVYAATLKNMMLKKDPTFSEVRLGYSQFKDFLAEQKDIVDVDTRDSQVKVSLQPKASEKITGDPSTEYRRALDQEGLHLLDPNTRSDILRDLFILLSQNPQRYTLDAAEMHLKAHYDSTNILRSRDEVHEVTKLIRYTDVIEPVPGSWELDSLSIKPAMDQQLFIDLCESVYITALTARHLKVKVDLVAKLLFGTADKRERVQQLSRLVESRAPEPAGEKKVRKWQLPASMANKPVLQPVLNDLKAFELEGEPTLEWAFQSNDEGMKIRSADFAQAQRLHLQAAKIMYQLLQKETPGASLVDLEWLLASYCADSAGAAFFRRDYSAAIDYYLAFFSLAVETAQVWEKVERLANPMVSFYFTIAANRQQVMLDASPGHQHPAKIVTLVLNNANTQVQENGKELARKLAEVNPGLLRKIVQRLETIVANGNGEKADEEKACQVLLGILPVQ